jgi:putative transposase
MGEKAPFLTLDDSPRNKPKIQPGNGIIERLNKTLQIECTDQYWFTTMEELNEALDQWSVAYNTLRPYQSIGYKTPDRFEILNQKTYYTGCGLGEAYMRYNLNHYREINPTYSTSTLPVLVPANVKYTWPI